MRPRGVGVAVAGLLVVVVFLFTCGENGPSGEGDASTNTKCAKGLKPVGPACVPIFDECLDDEVPLLGGGCKRVGVKECNGGWGIADPPDWKCKPIGTPRKCLKGWAKVKGGWCEPILPRGKCSDGTMPDGPCSDGTMPKVTCPNGTMEKIGYSNCQPIGDCGTGTWGKIKTTASTIYVDQTYNGGGSDGSQSKPFLTIGAALFNATTGKHIAVAAGTYKENVSIMQKVTLEGVCASKVFIYGTGTSQAVDIGKGASGTRLEGVTITSGNSGLRVHSTTATVARVAVRKCDWRGILVDSGSTLTLLDSLVADNRAAGLVVLSSKATVERTVVRNTRSQASDMRFGAGIQVAAQAGLSGGSELALRDSLVADNRTAGLVVLSSKATVERSVVRGTQAQFSDKQFGAGIQASVRAGQTRGSELVLRDSLVAGNRNGGIAVVSSKATIERSVVRDTREQASNQQNGLGIYASVEPGLNRNSELLIRNSLVVGNRTVGVMVSSSRATVERSVVRGTKEQVSDRHLGVGIEVAVFPGQTQDSVLVLRDTLVTGNRTAGMVIRSSRATVERSIVRDTKEQVSDEMSGLGIYVKVASKLSRGSELMLRDSLVASNRTSGVSVRSSKATVERSVVRDTRGRASDDRLGAGIEVSVGTGLTRGSELMLYDSLVVGNRTVGVRVASSNATMARSVVRDTLEQSSDNSFGLGIQASVEQGLSRGSRLVLRDSLVAANLSTGVTVLGSNATVDRSVVGHTRTDGTARYGDGLVAEESMIQLRDTMMEHSARAGMLFITAGGSVRRCLIRRNVFSIDLESGANPTIGDDNLMVDNKVNKVTTGRGLKVAPMPTAPNPLGSDSGAGSTKDAGPPP